VLAANAPSGDYDTSGQRKLHKGAVVGFTYRLGMGFHNGRVRRSESK
jgi:hypothetical protein